MVNIDMDCFKQGKTENFIIWSYKKLNLVDAFYQLTFYLLLIIFFYYFLFFINLIVD